MILRLGEGAEQRRGQAMTSRARSPCISICIPTQRRVVWDVLSIFLSREHSHVLCVKGSQV